MAEHLYWIAGKDAVPAERVGLAEVGLREVADLQEWVIQHPEVLGPDVLIVASEYNSWASAQGLTAKERLDVLGLDLSGRLVVAELERESDPTVHIQAITYAALVSGFDADLLVEVFAEFRRKRGQDLTLEQARVELQSHVEGELDGEILANPRLVLVAHVFPPQVLTSAEWLSVRGIDIALVQVQAWRIGGGIAATFDQVYPIPGVGDALLAPARRKVAEANEKVQQRARSATAVSIIIEKELVADGQIFRFIPGRDVAADVRIQLADWIEANPDRAAGRPGRLRPRRRCCAGSRTGIATPPPGWRPDCSWRPPGCRSRCKEPCGGSTTTAPTWPPSPASVGHDAIGPICTT